MSANSLALNSALRLFQKLCFVFLRQGEGCLVLAGFGDPLSQKPLRLFGKKLSLVLVLKFSEQRLRDPSSAIVGADFTIIDHHYTAIGFLHQHLAGGYENAEVGDRSLRREAKPLSKLLFEGSFNGV